MATQRPPEVRRGDAPPRPRPATGPTSPAPAPAVGRVAAPPAARPPGVPAPPDPDATWSWWTGETREYQVPWDKRASVRRPPPPVLRLPAPEDPAPAAGHMIGVCAWAALLAVVGLAVAFRALVALLAGGTPGWYEPTVIGFGLVGLALVTAAFLAVHQRRLPWLLLAGATVPLGINLLVTATI